MQARAVDAGQGWSWFVCGFRIFRRSPGLWIVLGISVLVLMAIVLHIPVIGGLALALLSPALSAGLLYAAHAADEQRPVELGHLVQPFRDSAKTHRLLALGAVALGGTVVSVILAVATVGTSMMGANDLAAMQLMGTRVLLVILIVLAVQLLVTMAIIYAIPLIMFRDVPVRDAVRSSFTACVRNFLPLLVFSLVYLVAAIVASIPFMLGWLALLPASAAMLYCSYKDIYPPA